MLEKSHKTLFFVDLSQPSIFVSKAGAYRSVAPFRQSLPGQAFTA
jgi:hypothetical protein